MKILIVLSFFIIATGCKVEPDNKTNDAAIHFAGVFITENIPSSLNLKVKVAPDVKSLGNDTFHITGLVEGYSSYNVPFSIEHFSETLHYSGGGLDDRKNWECIEIYVGKKKLK